ncbi:MAG: tetratricopeptide repeat protein [Fimbriimonadales bacterium]|nr:tetratricopeptide repeat protein [Fimbriimonadales bacterium]
MRDFLAQLREKFGIVIGVEYLGGGKVELRLRDDELWFARGLAHLWSGRVAEALRAFEQAARLNGDYAAPARELAAWLRDGLAPSQLSLLGVIRIEWWNLPDDIKVYIDSASETIEVPHGAPLLVVADGIYTLRLVDKHGKELVNQPFRVRHDQVFEVELRGSNV